VEFKPYGVILNVEPMVDNLNNVIAKVETEISTIDNANKVNGIPGVKTRNTSTEVNLQPEQTLVIAGLLLSNVSMDFDKVKWLGDLPILGPLFRSKDYENGRTELMIFITPYVRDVGDDFDAEKARARAAQIEADFEKLKNGDRLLD
jgi:pilus assembly protein CpaC